MTETKKAPDYSNTAENLCNPLEVKELLDLLHRRQADVERLQGQIPVELANDITQAESDISQLMGQVKSAIEDFGSYQDMELGFYAVKYRRMIKSYHVEPFKERFPKFVDAVVEETINVKALEGLVKGGLIKEDELLQPLKSCGQSVITEKPQFVFFVR